jgi:hypothetical protein
LRAGIAYHPSVAGFKVPVKLNLAEVSILRLLHGKTDGCVRAEFAFLDRSQDGIPIHSVAEVLSYKRAGLVRARIASSPLGLPHQRLNRALTKGNPGLGL